MTWDVKRVAEGRYVFAAWRSSGGTSCEPRRTSAGSADRAEWSLGRSSCLLITDGLPEEAPHQLPVNNNPIGKGSPTVEALQVV